MRTRPIESLLVVLIAACSSVHGGDETLYESSHNLNPQIGAPMGQAGMEPSPMRTSEPVSTGGGAPTQGAGGSGTIPPQQSDGGSPGAPSQGGATSTVGAGGGGTPGGSAGEPNVAAGGSMLGAGGETVAPGAGGEMPSSGGAPGAGGAPDLTPKECNVKLDFVSVTYRGRYAPDNIVAVWVNDAAGNFVKTVALWGIGNIFDNIKYAVEWNEQSGNNRVDAVTAATRHSHGPVSATWRCETPSGEFVTPGAYQMCIELEENDILPFFGPEPHFTCIDFDTSMGPFQVTGQDEAPFTNITLTMQ